jgi:hypothetical protein
MTTRVAVVTGVGSGIECDRRLGNMTRAALVVDGGWTVL